MRSSIGSQRGACTGSRWGSTGWAARRNARAALDGGVARCGDSAALSHRSAAALWGVGEELAGRIDLTVRGRFESRRAGLKVRSRASLRAANVVERNGILVTSIVQTLVDLATELADGPLERAVNEADKHDLIDPGALREALAKRPASRAPNASRRCSTIDFHWPLLGLVVETDGLRYHRTPGTQARDRVGDQIHTAAGLTQLRFTHWQVRHEPRYVEAILRRTASRLPR